MDAHLEQFERDPVDEVLNDLYLHDWQAIELALAPGVGIKTPRGAAAMYIVHEGSPSLEFIESGHPPIHMSSGDHLIVTSGDPHRVCVQGDPQVLDIDPWSTGLRPSLPRSPQSIRLLCARFRLGGVDRNPLDSGLARVIHRNHHRDQGLGRCLPVLEQIRSRCDSREPGWQIAVGRLAELVLIDTLATELSREMLSNRETGASGMLAGLADPAIGTVLRLMVRSPNLPWTVAMMARKASISRSAFSERFRDRVGLPPLQYLTEIRMRRACQLLRESEMGIGRVATLVGYESPSSFSNAFKRWAGVAPVQYRRHGNDELPY